MHTRWLVWRRSSSQCYEGGPPSREITHAPRNPLYAAYLAPFSLPLINRACFYLPGLPWLERSHTLVVRSMLLVTPMTGQPAEN